jgi:hypothetical protein
VWRVAGNQREREEGVVMPYNAWSMLRKGLPSLLAGVVLVTWACESPFGPVDRDVEVVLLTDTVYASVDEATVEFSVYAELRNHDDVDVFLRHCGHRLQHFDGSRWRTVAVSPCLPGTRYPLLVGPTNGALVAIGVRLPRHAGSDGWPEVGLEGDYRVIASVIGVLTGGGGGQPIAVERCTSAPFPVRVREP